jgi:hypothetical protein
MGPKGEPDTKTDRLTVGRNINSTQLKEVVCDGLPKSEHLNDC